MKRKIKKVFLVIWLVEVLIDIIGGVVEKSFLLAGSGVFLASCAYGVSLLVSTVLVDIDALTARYPSEKLIVVNVVSPVKSLVLACIVENIGAVYAPWSLWQQYGGDVMITVQNILVGRIGFIVVDLFFAFILLYGCNMCWFVSRQDIVFVGIFGRISTYSIAEIVRVRKTISNGDQEKYFVEFKDKTEFAIGRRKDKNFHEAIKIIESRRKKKR